MGSLSDDETPVYSAFTAYVLAQRVISGRLVTAFGPPGCVEVEFSNPRRALGGHYPTADAAFTEARRYIGTETSDEAAVLGPRLSTSIPDRSLRAKDSYAVQA